MMKRKEQQLALTQRGRKSSQMYDPTVRAVGSCASHTALLGLRPLAHGTRGLALVIHASWSL